MSSLRGNVFSNFEKSLVTFGVFRAFVFRPQARRAGSPGGSAFPGRGAASALRTGAI
jgi:hypothetical protein